MSQVETKLTFNGVNGSTGLYDIPPMSSEALAKSVLGTVFEPKLLAELMRKDRLKREAQFAPKQGVDRKKLEQTGWGVIFALGADQALYKALAPLLELRRSQAGKLYREYLGPDAYRPGETKLAWLQRHGAGPGPAVPEVVPYYLLIVGEPETIPYSFQYQLDVQYAVGRICFDTLADYATYARSVVEAETGTLALAKSATLFAAANPGDGATNLSLDGLAKPLLAWAAEQKDLQGQPSWKVASYLGEQATKSRLTSILASEAPAFLFTASHGMCFNPGDPRQLSRQGALLCQDWPGPSHAGPIPDSFFFSGDDVADDARIFGSIAMHFACFGAGTPSLSDFHDESAPPAIAPRSFVGHLPQRLLAHPRGGVLAVIGHVERAWGWSFMWDRAGSQTEVFKSTILRLMEGYPVGAALEWFNERYAELSTELSTAIADINAGADADPYLLSGMWTANYDARNYAVIGDPAVRLRFAADDKPFTRPLLEVIPIPISSSNLPAEPIPAGSTPAPAPSLPPAPAAPAPTPAQPPLAPNYNAMVDYGVVDSVRNAANALQDAAQKIGEWLAGSFQKVTTVQVRTYVSDNISEAKFENGVFTGARLRAQTIASLDGNTVVLVPENDGKVDDALWKIHADTFEKALENRIRLLETAATTAASLVPGLK